MALCTSRRPSHAGGLAVLSIREADASVPRVAPCLAIWIDVDCRRSLELPVRRPVPSSPGVPVRLSHCGNSPVIPFEMTTRARPATGFPRTLMCSGYAPRLNLPLFQRHVVSPIDRQL